MATTTQGVATPALESNPPDAESSAHTPALVRAIGTVGLAGLVACLFLLGANAAFGPSSYVPSGANRFPSWLAGPLRPFGFSASHGTLEGLALAVCGCYAIVLACSAALPARRIWITVVLADLAAMLAPPLLSTDVIGYIGFARLGVLHGLSPYSFNANAAPHDAIYPYLGWHTVTTPYGPLFTLLTYPLVPLGIPADLWTLKAVAAVTSLATIVVLWRVAKRLGRTPKWVVAMYGLNPLVLIFAVGGAHNDTLFGLLIAAGVLWLISGRERAAAISLVAALAIKVSAGLVIPFALIGSKRRKDLGVWMLAGAALIAIVGFAVFGLDLGSRMWRALLDEQHQVAVHCLPAELSMLFGLPHFVGSGSSRHVVLAEGVRIVSIALFAAAAIAVLWRAWRGAWWLDCYGWIMVALLACSAWLLPWYGMWVLLPASVSSSRRLQAAALVTSAYCASIKIL